MLCLEAGSRTEDCLLEQQAENYQKVQAGKDQLHSIPEALETVCHLR